MDNKIYKSYKFRLLPKEDQILMLEKHFGCSRFVYNYFLKEKQEYYLKNKQSLNYNNCSSVLTSLKKNEEFKWLNEVNSQTLQASLKNLETSYGNFFKKKTKFPRFKSKKSKNSFQIPQYVYVEDNYVQIPKFVKSNKLKFIKTSDTCDCNK